MRKFSKTIIGIATTLASASLMMATPVMAAPSIGQLVPSGIQLITGGTALPKNTALTLQDANTNQYLSSTVKSGVDKFNDDDSITSVSDFLNNIDATQTDVVSTNNGKTLDVSNLEALMPVVDLVATDGSNSYYDINGNIQTSFKTELAKDMDKDDLVIMEVNPNDGSVSFIEPTDYNSETGEITANFDSLGGITLLKYSNSDDDVVQAKAEVPAETEADTQVTTTASSSVTVNNDTKDSPATSDSTNIGLKVLLLSTAVAGMTGAMFTRKRNK